MEGGPDKPEAVVCIEIKAHQQDNDQHQEHGQDLQQGQEGFFKSVHSIFPPVAV